MDDTREKLRNLRKSIRESFATRMLKHGFDRHSGGTFYRKTASGRIGITLFYHDYGDSIKIEASASLRIDKAEELLFEYRTTAEVTRFGPPKKPNDFTVCENLGNIKTGVWRQWFIYQESDVEETLDQIETLVEEVGLPFLKRLSEPELLLEEMINSTLQRSILGSPVHRFSQLFALILALDRRDVFDEMRGFFEDRLRDNGQFRFENVVHYLDWIDSRL
ncbi:MAG: hypothetical protein AB7Q37_04745 [Pyrinomonadaceae bacterium]